MHSHERVLVIIINTTILTFPASTSNTAFIQENKYQPKTLLTSHHNFK